MRRSSGFARGIALVTAVAGLAACNVIGADNPDPSPYSGLGEASGGLLGQSYEARLAQEVAEASTVCAADVGEHPGTVGHEFCVFTILGTPQAQLDDFVVPDEDRWPPAGWVAENWSAFKAYRARFVGTNQGQEERLIRMAAFLDRQKTLLAGRAEIAPVEAQPEF